MGKPKKAQAAHHTGIKKSNSSTNPDRISKGPHMRTKSTINRLNMYRTKPIRDTDGKFVAGAFMSRELPTTPFIQPNRRWFGKRKISSIKNIYFKLKI